MITGRGLLYRNPEYWNEEVIRMRVVLLSFWLICLTKTVFEGRFFYFSFFCAFHISLSDNSISHRFDLQFLLNSVPL